MVVCLLSKNKVTLNNCIQLMVDCFLGDKNCFSRLSVLERFFCELLSNVERVWNQRHFFCFLWFKLFLCFVVETFFLFDIFSLAVIFEIICKHVLSFFSGEEKVFEAKDSCYVPEGMKWSIAKRLVLKVGAQVLFFSFLRKSYVYFGFEVAFCRQCLRVGIRLIWGVLPCFLWFTYLLYIHNSVVLFFAGINLAIILPRLCW